MPPELYKTVLLCGAPGAGKGTQGKILGSIPGFFHLSCGDVFRTININSAIGQKICEYTSRGDLEGLRSDKWKLLVKKPRANRRANANQQKNRTPEVFLFDLAADVGEQNNLAEAKSGIVKKLRARMEALDAEITKNARQPWVKN